MNTTDAKRIASSTKTVHGWFSDEAAQLFALIDEIQKTGGITGPLFEIGVHEGKSAIFLASMLNAGSEHLGICDIFEQQGHNASGSGQGKRALFESNMKSLAPSSIDMRIHATLSGNLTPATIGTGYRFFHIDGGHNADEALADLHLGASVLCAGGAIVLDDPFRPEWPGVTEAVVRFLDQNQEFRAIAVGFNKLVLVRAGDEPMYRKAISDEAHLKEIGLGFPWHLKELPFVGKPLLIFYIPTTVSNQPWPKKLYRQLVGA